MMRTDAYRQFKKCLFSGELRPGQFVSQRELADLLGVPMNPIREAVRQLESERLINVYPKKGIQIVEGDPKTINDAHDYRLLLEIAAITEFARNAPLELIDRIGQDNQAALQAMETLSEEDEALASSVETAWDFHEAIIDFQENQIISHHFRLNTARIRLFRSHSYRHRMREQLVPALRKHLDILKACAERNVDQAVHLITEDVETSRTILLGRKPA